MSCLSYTTPMNWYTCVACKSCLPLSGDAAKVEERINRGLALQPLPLATNPSPHTEGHLKSAHPCAGAHISKRHEASSAQLSPPKTSGKCVPREAWLTSWALRKQKTPPKAKILFFFSFICFGSQNFWNWEIREIPKKTAKSLLCTAIP